MNFHCSNDVPISASQPEPRRHLDSGLGSDSKGDDCAGGNESLWFSQPIRPDHMLLSSQLPCTPGSSQVKEQQQQKQGHS